MLDLLATGDVDIQARLPWSSNGTYLVTVTGEGTEVAAVYKPGQAERPLWDFPDGLYRREVAAFELAQVLGWPIVPPTVEVSDAPLGPGSLQLFVDADFEQHYFTLFEDGARHAALKQMATFDALANNADRKGGHCLIDSGGRIWGIDHGLCFHPEPKLRTVIWDFAGEPIAPADADAIMRLADRGLPDGLGRLLHEDERAALMDRARDLLRSGKLPQPYSDRPFPWPLV